MLGTYQGLTRNATRLHSYYVPFSGWNRNLQQPQAKLASLMSTASQLAHFFFTISHYSYCNFPSWGMSKKRMNDDHYSWCTIFKHTGII